MRNPPKNPTPPPPDRQADPERIMRIIMIREYKLLTPLFGGGVIPGEVDEKFPIRGSAIRGQLRFWWRATCGGRFGQNGKAAMNKAEGELWGSTKQGSQVTIDVTTLSSGNVLKLPNNKKGEPVFVGDPDSRYGYVAFPLRESKGVVREKVTFELVLSFPNEGKIQKDLQATLWAWETFGGVGARTRRGFGALHCTGISPGPGSAPFEKADWQWEYKCEEIEKCLHEKVRYFVSEGEFPLGTPHLSRQEGRYKLTNVNASAMKVWEHLIDELKDYRQNRNGKYGRSNWPEPDATRKLTGQSLKKLKHDDPVHKPRIDKFPRAAFGLPILFGFHPDHKPQEGDEMNPDRDPRDTTLQGALHDRLASPLILRPLPCRGGQYVGLALILEGRHIPPRGLLLKGISLNEAVKSNLGGNEPSQIATLHSWKKIGPDVLQSFLNGLKKEIK